ncbi:MAG: carbohydrate ABC transporter permease [Lachnospiraceae bacterium]|nr:carbohydrate ABC transporter permease [Lachnospiraceae bacterium]
MKARRKIEKTFTFFVLLAVGIIYLVPILMMLLGSFKDAGEVLQFNLALPTIWHPENYLYVLETGNILRGYANSLIVTVSAVIVTLLSGAFAGIVIARNSGRSSNALYYYFIFGLTATMQTVTTFALLKVIRLYGSYFGVIMVFVASNLPFTVMSFTSFVKGVPRELDEAASMDGCSPMGIMLKIHLPILKPIMVTNLIIVAISVWNNLMIPLYFFNSSKKMTIPLTIYNFFGMYSRNWHYVFAAMTLTVLPVIILYLCLQKHIVAGMTAGAVKG